MRGDESFWRPANCLSVLAISAGVAVIVHLLQWLGYFRAWEAPVLDVITALNRPEPSGEVYLVGIDDQDFYKEFDGISPLSPARLGELLKEIAKHGPAVVAVDIFVGPIPREAPSRRRDRIRLHDTLRELAEAKSTDGTRWLLLDEANVRWPDSLGPLDNEVQDSWSRLGNSENLRITWVSPRLTTDHGVVRRIPFCDRDTTSGIASPTLMAAADDRDFGVGCTSGSESERPIGELEIRYTGRFGLFAENPYVRPARFLLEVGRTTSSRHVGLTTSSALRGNVVVVGGLYALGHDRFWTPVGSMSGAQVWAEAIDTLRRDDFLRHAPLWFGLPVEILIGVMGGWLMHRFGPMKGYGIAFVCLVPITLFAAWSAAVGKVFINAIPSFFAVQLHQRIELYRETKRLQSEIDAIGRIRD